MLKIASDFDMKGRRKTLQQLATWKRQVKGEGKMIG